MLERKKQAKNKAPRLYTCFIALGSNLEDPSQQLQTAINTLHTCNDVAIQKVSSFYQTAPVGYADQPDFINAVIKAKTNLSAHSLLKLLQRIENQQGRTRSANQNGPRTLDLDLLLYDNRRICTTELTVPHPRMWERAFVLQPLAEIAKIKSGCKLARK